jgi:hypothetical protein
MSRSAEDKTRDDNRQRHDTRDFELEPAGRSCYERNRGKDARDRVFHPRTAILPIRILAYDVLPLAY